MTPTLRTVLRSLEQPDLRPVHDDDAAELIALVEAAYDQYPGCVLDLPGIDADLVAPATSARDAGVVLWVVTDGGRIVGSVGAGPRSPEGEVELKRLYVAASHRRRGLAAGLVDLVEQRARELDATHVDLWSDTRFTDAHRLYERLGYHATGRTRHLGDPSDTTEYHFRRELEYPSGPGTRP